MSTNPRPNPYVGPRSFQTGEKLYGRDSELQQLLDLFIAERIVLLYSPSGAGKSSLVQAGLVPCLQVEGFDVLPIVRVNLEPPSDLKTGEVFNRYVFSALLSLEEGLPASRQTPIQDLVGMTLDEYLTRRPRDENEPDTQVLIFDQFEEILTQEPMDRAGKMAFFTQVGTALRNRKRWALFSMREDYVPTLDPYLRPVPTRLANTFRLDLLGVDSARQAIQNPAREAGVEMPNPAANKLVDDLRRVQVQLPDGMVEEQLGLYVEPVQLQVVCFRLWQQLAPDQAQITETDLASVGDVDESLAEYYAERVGATAIETRVREREIRDWFDNHLITRQGIRGQVLMEPGKSEGLDNRAIRLLENAHLVRAEKRRGATWFELAHDRLLDPVCSNNTAWKQANLSLLQRQATLWESQDRSDSLVLRDEQLVEAEGWATSHPDELTATDTDFLRKSRELRSREEEARSAAERQLKLEAAENLAQSERRRAELQTRHASQLRRRAVILVMLLVVVLALAAVSVYFWNEANKNADRQTVLAVEKAAIAEERSRIAATSQANEKLAISQSKAAATAEADADFQRATAVANSQIAEHAKQDALEQRDKAEGLRREVESNSLALLSAEYFDQQPDLALLMAVESYRRIESDPGSEGPWQAINAVLAGLGRKISQKAQGYDGKSIPPQSFSVQKIAFSPDGKKLAWAGSEGEVHVWDLQQGLIALSWKVPSKKTVNTLSFNHRGNLLATGDDDGKLILWDSSSGARKQTYNTALSRVLDLAFSPNDTTVAVSGTSRSIYLWDVTLGYKGALASGGYGPCVLAWAPTGNFLATGCADKKIRIFNPSTGLEEKRLEGHEGAVLSIAWSGNGKWLVSGGEDDVRPKDKTLLLWDLEKGKLIPLSGHTEKVMSVAFSPDNKTLASGSADRTLILWNVDGFAPIDKLTDYGNWVNSLAFSPPGGTLLASVSFDRKIRLNKLLTQESIWESVPFHKDKVLGLFFGSGDQLALVDNSRDNMLRFWEKPFQEGQENLLSEYNGQYSSAAFSPDGKEIALGSPGGEIQIKDFKTGSARLQFQAHDGPILGMAYHPFGTLLAVAVCTDPQQVGGQCSKNEIQLWDIQSDQPEKTGQIETQHTDTIFSLAFTPDGHTLASGGKDRDIWLYKGSFTGQPPQVEASLLTRHTSTVTSLVFNPSGEVLAIGGQDGTLALWAVTALRKLGDPFAGTGAALISLAYGPDGKKLVSGSEDGSILVWDLDVASWINQLCTLAGRNLTVAEWDSFISGEQYSKTCPQWP